MEKPNRWLYRGGVIRALICLTLLAAQVLAGPAALNLKGERVAPLEDSKSKAVVLFFLGVDCPISNSYAPTYKRLAEQFKEVRFFAVYPNADETEAVIAKHLKEYKLPLEALRDVRHELVKAAGAKTTPEAAVFLPDGKLVYRGRVDNRHVSFGKKRPAATEHDLRDVLAAIVAGKAVEFRAMPSVGCSIPPLEGKP